MLTEGRNLSALMKTSSSAARSNTGQMLRSLLKTNDSQNFSGRKITKSEIPVKVLNSSVPDLLQGLQTRSKPGDIILNTNSISTNKNFPVIMENPNYFSPRHLIQLSNSGLISNRRSKRKVLTAEQQDNIIIKCEWRELGKYQMFDDYLRIRDAKGLKSFKNDDTDHNETKQDSIKLKPQMFSCEENEKAYKEDQRKKEIDRLKDSLLKPQSDKMVKSSFFGAEEKTLSPQRREVRLLNECFKTLEKIKGKLTLSTIEGIQPLSDDLNTMFTHFGVVNFYLISLFLNSLILQSYGRSRASYANWKKFLRTCNIQGSAHHKYKLIAYKHLSRCCVDLGKLDKAMIYLKKMLKLSWVVDDRNYELLSYDMISVILFYHRDLEKASFYHNKFVRGHYEEKSEFHKLIQDSGVRSIGESNYILSQEMKMHIMDKNSFSEDDFDLDTIIQKSNLEKWTKEQKDREQQKLNKQNEKYSFYKKGVSFAKQDDNIIKGNQILQRSKIQQYRNRWAEQLGPIYKKPDGDRDPIKDLLINRNVAVVGANIPVMVNHQSPVRAITQYLFLQEKGYQKPADDQIEEVVFKPIEHMRILKKLLNVFQSDISFFSRHNILFIDAQNL